MSFNRCGTGAKAEREKRKQVIRKSFLFFLELSIVQNASESASQSACSICRARDALCIIVIVGVVVGLIVMNSCRSGSGILFLHAARVVSSEDTKEKMRERERKKELTATTREKREEKREKGRTRRFSFDTSSKKNSNSRRCFSLMLRDLDVFARIFVFAFDSFFPANFAQQSIDRQDRFSR